MARDDDPISMTVKTEIALVVRRIAKEYTQGGTSLFVAVAERLG